MTKRAALPSTWRACRSYSAGPIESAIQCPVGFRWQLIGRRSVVKQSERNCLQMYAMGGGRGVSRQAPAPRTGRAGACGVFERHAGGRRQEYNRRMTAKRFNDPIEPMTAQWRT